MAERATSLMWFRRDLRLSDNPALVEAVRTGVGGVVPLFVVDPALWEPAGANRRAFLVACLRALDAELDGALVVRHGDPVEVVPAVVEEVGAGTIHVADDFGPYGRDRDDRVEAALGDGRRLERVGSPYAVEPGRVLNQAGEPYRVFTPFRKAWMQVGWPDPVRRPSHIEWVRGIDTDPLPEVEPTAGRLPEAGESAAQAALDHFLRSRVEQYVERRNEPGVEGTSRLSPYLKWGCIHPRQILSRLGDTAGDDVFRSELAWREFYADVLFHHPSSARRALQDHMSSMAVDEGPETDAMFTAWCEGRTGYPMVDAGMRQLLAEGWMHNRVRMITASFLVKDLHLDWTRGARHFMTHLVDGDLASNQHGWQWVAGTGTDSAPYFRVFNPVAQSKRFDPDGTYLRRWLPELGGLDDRLVHEPWKADGGLFVGDTDYPDPVVDHDAERREALARYDEVRAARIER